jgi:cell division protein FtsQ
MNAKTTIRKIMFVTMWLCIGAGMLTLLLAAISKKNRGECRDYTITIKGAQNNFFIDKKDVEQMLVSATKGNIKGEQVSSFNLHALEQMLEHNTWIDEAELYFDNRDILHVTVTEKEPVARIFTTTGNSFYIDSLGRTIPLSDKLSARVPVFTGFPARKKLTAADSVLLNEVRMAANYITNDPFWLSQVAQVDITAQRNFEMIPVVGDHLVRLGNGENIAQKFHRLMVFYKQVLSKTGFDRYKLIDVQYKGQVVVSKYAGDPKVDSIQLKRNVEKLLRQSMEAENDTMIRAMPPLVKLEADSVLTVDPSLQDKPNPESNSNPNPRLDNPSPLIPKRNGDGQADRSSLPKTMDKRTTPKPVKATPKPADPKRQPKAVMPKKTAGEEENGGYN